MDFLNHGQELQRTYEPMFLTADTDIANRYREKQRTGGTFTYRTITWCHENFLIRYSTPSIIIDFPIDIGIIDPSTKFWLMLYI